MLRDPQIGGFEVRTLLDEPAHVVSLAVAEFFADRKPDDLLLHFSCHGVKDEDGELYFAAAMLAAITGGLALAQVITAVVLLTGKLSVWDTAAWICIAVALGCLVAAALAGRVPGARTA